MFCRNCNKEIPGTAHFCRFCGASVKNSLKKICPRCGWNTEFECVYCEECGSLLKDQSAPQPAAVKMSPTQNPQAKNSSGPLPVSQAPINEVSAASRPDTDIMYYHPLGTLPVTFKMVSVYNGTPEVGISKATGNLTVYPDRLEFRRVLGSSLGNAFGLAGILAAKKTNTMEPLVSHYYRDISYASTGTYAAVFNTLVLRFSDGTTLSYVPALPNSEYPEKIANLIIRSRSGVK